MESLPYARIFSDMIGAFFPHISALTRAASKRGVTGVFELQLATINLACLLIICAKLLFQRQPPWRLVPRRKLLFQAFGFTMLSIPIVAFLTVWDGRNVDEFFWVIDNGPLAISGAIIFLWWCVAFAASCVLADIQLLVSRTLSGDH
jgi:hypothetical protein